ncbi:MAG: hypothetical protein OEM46_03285 [Ignavibacteria bacterium]|nr:hypothetical protein [Ignavibacteria bacterium]
MSTKNTINEGQTSYHTFSFYDEDDQEVVPDSVFYCMIDYDSREKIIDWTEVSAAQEVEVEIPAAKNEIEVSGTKYSRERAVCIQAVYNTDKVLNDEDRYRIVDLKGFPKA